MLQNMDDLIEGLETDIADNAPYIASIRKPRMLISALKDLNNMIGNHELKKDVAKQVDYLIDSKNDPDHSEPIMLHTLLYGLPGVGKTSIGKHMARIWYSLGYIGNDINIKRNYRSTTDSQTKKKSEWDDIFDKLMSDNMEDIQSGYAMLMIFVAIISVLGVIWGYLWGILKTCYNVVGLKWMLIVGVLLLIVTIIFLFSYLFSSSPCKICKQKKCVCKTSDHGGDIKVPDQASTINTVEEEVDDNDLIDIVSGEDFIGQYVGWTEKQTTALLQKSKGKVLFIDEAYSIMSSSGQGDVFGEKALNIINRYMSEHPEELIIIMAGYEDKIKNNLFRAQPGLARRFMWSFNCKGYSIGELFEIWQQQIHPKKLTDKAKTLEIFKKYRDTFPNHAGDTLRLVNFVKLEQQSEFRSSRTSRVSSQSVSSQTGKLGKEYVTPEQVERAIKVLARNTVKNKPSIDENSISPEMMEMIRAMSKR